jgi:hypothetical protein
VASCSLAALPIRTGWKPTLGRQPEALTTSGGVTGELIDFGWPQQCRILADVAPPIESDVGERDLRRLLHRVLLAGSDDVIVCLVLL